MGFATGVDPAVAATVGATVGVVPTVDVTVGVLAGEVGVTGTGVCPAGVGLG
jgi:hypothetical protein